MPKKKTAKSSKNIWIALIIILLTLIVIYKFKFQNSSWTHSSSPSITRKNILFDFASHSFAIDNQDIQFTGGNYSQNGHTATIESRSVNPAGNAAAAILIDSPGGSGTFYYLVGAMRKDGKEMYSQPIPLGDRIEIVGLSVEDPGSHDNGGIMVEYMDRPANAPMSDNPSVDKTSHFAFEDSGNLISVLH